MGIGKGGGGPRPPDPVRTARDQYDWNRQAALDSARLNQVNQWTPFGGTYWTGEIGSPNRAQHTVLNPMLGRILFGGGYHPHFGGGGMGYGGGTDGGMAPQAHPWDMTGPVGGQAASPEPARQEQRRPVESDGGPSGADLAWPTGDDVDYGSPLAMAIGRGLDYIGMAAPKTTAALDLVDKGLDPREAHFAVDDYGGSPQGYDGGDWGGGDYDADVADTGWGFQMGGFTGLGTDNRLQPQRIAGRVHEGETVIPADQPEIQGLALALMGRDDDLSALLRDRGRNTRRSPMTSMPAAGGLAALLAGGR